MSALADLQGFESSIPDVDVQDYRATCAAVAELIAAVSAGVEVRTHNGPRLHYGPVESERLAAALARVQGGQS